MTPRIGRDDAVDQAMEDWGRERPDLDSTAMEISERIRRLASRIEVRAGKALSPHGVGSPGYSVLAALRRAGDAYELTPTELSRFVLLTSGAMTNRIDRLEQAGLVERVRSPTGDRRSVRIRLTAKGLEVETLATTSRFAAAEHAAGGLTETERHRLATLLRKAEAGLRGPG